MAVTRLSALAKRVDIQIHAGSNKQITVNVDGNDGEPARMDEWTSKFIVSRELEEELTLTKEDGGILHYPDTDTINKIIVNIKAADTRSLSSKYDYELKLYHPATDYEEVVLWGELDIRGTADR